MIGTVFFFIAHILYCVTFTIGTRVRYASSANKTIRVIVSIIYVIMCISNIYTLWDLMPNKLLFSAYAVVLCLMNIFSIKRY